MQLDRVVTQLGMVLGEPEARRLVDSCLGESGIYSVSSADELLALAQTLIKRGGFIEVVGRGLKVQALLAGGGSRVTPPKSGEDDHGAGMPGSSRRVPRIRR